MTKFTHLRNLRNKPVSYFMRTSLLTTMFLLLVSAGNSIYAQLPACSGGQSFSIDSLTQPTSPSPGPCPGDARGVLKADHFVNFVGATTYLWSNGKTTQQINDLPSTEAGTTYTCTVTDGGTCTVSASFTLHNLHPIEAVITFLPSCYGDAVLNVSNVVTGGTSPYTYSWTTGETDEDPVFVTPGLTGLQVLVTDVNGCTMQTPAITAPGTATQISTGAAPTILSSCKLTASGSITFPDPTTGGNGGPYLYSWLDNTSFLIVGTSKNLNPILPGIYTLTTTDNTGCTITASYTVLRETSAPTFTCPSAVTVSCAADTNAYSIISPAVISDFNLVLATAADAAGLSNEDCPPPLNDWTNNITWTNATTAGSCTNRFTVVRTWVVTDQSGNSTTCSQSITVNDVTAPAITCPVAVTVNSDAGFCYATGFSLGIPTVNDICAGTVTSVAYLGGSPVTPTTQFPVGPNTVTWVATDVCGNSISCPQSVTVYDAEAPTITCPADVTANNDAGNCSAVIASIGIPTTGDNCPGQTAGNNHPSTTYPVGTTDVVWTVTDAHGNTASCTQHVTVYDAEAPTITCPADVTANNDAGNCSAVIASIGIPTTGDNCPGQTAGNNHPSTTYPVGTTDVVWTVTDAHGNTASCTQHVTVYDAEAPTITCPADVTANNDAGNCSAVIASIGIPTTGDNCPGQTAGNNHPSTTYPVGTTDVVWTVTDAHGNTASCTQHVTVYDAEAPTITCPADVTANNDAGNCSAVIASIGIPTTGDNCPGQTAGNNHPSTTYPVGTTDVVWTVTDAHGNTASCTQHVTVYDAEAPTITCPADVTANNDAGNCSAVIASIGIPTTGDNCPGQTAGNNHPSTTYPVGTTDVVWTVTDAHGNTASCTQHVTVYDAEAPTITCPADVTANNDAGNCSAVIASIGIPTTGDNCPGQTAGNNHPSTTYPVGTTDVVWTVTDAHGNTASCTQHVTVYDAEAPTITCPADVTANNDAGNCSAVIASIGIPTTGDNCPGQTAGNNHPSTTYPVGTTDVVWTVTDAHGNTASCTQHVTVYDAEAPTITCPADVTANNDAGNCSAVIASIGIPTTGDNCPGQTAGNNHPSTTYPVGTTDVVWTVTDAHGNTASCTQHVTVYDAEAPTITCPADVTANNDAGNCSAVIASIGIPTTGDNCPGQTAGNNHPSTTYPVGTTDVVWTVTDAHGNTASCTQHVTVYDAEAPTITCPADVTANNDAGNCSAVIASIGIPTTGDNCPGQTAGNNHPSTTYPVGTTDVVWTVTDAHGNTASCTQHVTVYDAEAPTITCPADVTANNDAGNCSAVIASIGIPTTGDNCPGQTAGNNHPSTTYPVGTTDVVWTVTDAHGNTASCTQHVTVYDAEAPTITCPADVTANNDAGNCSAVIASIGIPTTGDNCPGQTAGNNHPSTTYPVGTTDVVWTVTDAHGNTASCTQHVTVYDAEAPTITCPADVTANNDAGNCSAVIASIGIPTTGDNCPGQTAGNNHPSTTYPVGTTDVVWTVTDAHGNTASCTQHVTVYDAEAPTITCPADVTANNDAGNCSAVIASIGIPTTGDNCPGQTAGNNHPSTTYPVGTTDVVWTVTDAHGNTASCTQHVTVYDAEAPTITCPADVTANNDAGNCSAVIASIGIPTTGDNCPGQTAGNNHPSTTYPVGTTDVVWTVTDAHGNTASCTQHVTVYDAEAPTITCPADVTANNDAGNCSAVIASIGIPTTGDNCPGQTAGNNHPSTTYPVGTTDVVWTVTDAHGNTASCTQHVTVYDAEAPTITCPADVTANNDAGNCSAVIASIGIPTTGDNCPGQTAGNNHPSTTYPVGTTDVVWTVTDAHGNTASCTQHVTVYDAEAPTITCPADVTANNDAGNCSAVIASIGIPTTGDNCPGQTAGNNHPSTTYPVGTTDVVWTVTDAHGNTASCTQHVTVYDAEAPTITCPADVTANNDAGNCSAVIASIGIPTTGDNCPGQTAGNNHPSTTYPVGTTDVVWTVTDAHGNTASCTQHVTVYDAEAPTITCPASITVNPSNAACQYTGSIGTATGSDNCSSPAISHLPVGPYSIGTTIVTWKATDASGNTATCTQSVTVLAPTVTNNPAKSICSQTSTNIVLTANMPCTFTWSIGATTAGISGFSAGAGGTINQSLLNASSTVPGTVQYIVTPTATGGCVGAPFTITVTVNPRPNISGVATAVKCKGSNDGSIDATASNGTPYLVPPLYTYLWNNGYTTEDLSNLFAGNYTVTVTDANGCTRISALINVAQPASVLSVSISKTNVRCGGKATGNITALPSGGGGGYVYVWSSNASTGVGYPSAATISSLPAGIYTVSVTDANGCTKTKSAEITQNPIMTVTVTPLPAANQRQTTIAGGVGPFTYLWNSANASAQSGSDPGGLPGFTTTFSALGNYKVKITDSKGCTVISSPVSITSLTKAGPQSAEESILSAYIYPNPSDGIVNLNIVNTTNQSSMIKLYNAIGELVFTKQIGLDDRTATFDFSTYPKGLYTFSVTAGDKIQIIKVVLQ